MDRMQIQSDEFDACNKLAERWRILQQVPVVDDDYPRVRHEYEGALRTFLAACEANDRVTVKRPTIATTTKPSQLTFAQFREANRTRCLKWHPQGIESWSDSDWMTAILGELGELASLIKMRNRERDGLPGNKFSPTDKQVADEAADVFTYLDLFCERNGIDLGAAAVSKFNEISVRVGFPDRIELP